MRKLKTALYGAAMVGCAFATAAWADTQSVGSLKVIAAAEASRPVSFDVFLPLRNKDKLEALLKAQQDPASKQYQHWLTPQQFGAAFGPDKATIERVAASLRARGFDVKPYTRSLRVSGTADQVNRAFGVHLLVASSEPGAMHVVTNESFKMPADLASAGAQIFSFAPHVSHVFSRIVGKVDPSKRTAHGDASKQLHGYLSNKQGSTDNRYSETGPYWFDDLKEAYSYPSALATVTVNGKTQPLNGTGVTIAALMSSDVLNSDITAVFEHEHWGEFATQPRPKLTRRYVNGGAKFGNGASVEASLDTQQELTGAPGAKAVLYDIPDLSDGSVMAGYTDIDEDNNVDVVSSSFGECELFYFPRYNGGQDYRGIPQAEHELFMQGNAQGITFLASSDDQAGKACPSPSYLEGGPKARFKVGVSVPASDPNVTAVGGTNLVTTYVQGTLDSAYAGENAWEDPMKPEDLYGTGVPTTGGYWGAGSGYSAIFSKPEYQTLVDTGSTTMRAVPDIGMQVGGCPVGAKDFHHGACNGGADPNNGSGNTQRSSVVVGYGVGKGGGFYAIIGTSVSSPEFAGALAHLVEQKGRMGNINGRLYRMAVRQSTSTRTAKRYFHTNIPGYNGVENTNLNNVYSLSTGVGTPIVVNMIDQPSAPRAGLPQSPSNP